MLKRAFLVTSLIAGYVVVSPLFLPAHGQSGGQSGDKLIPMQTLAGGNTFFIDPDSIQNNSGTLNFSVLGFPGTQPDTSQGYNKSSASIDCTQGSYQASYANENVNDSGSSSSNGLQGSAAPMTLRNDGKQLYKSMRDLCQKYSGLKGEDMSGW